MPCFGSAFQVANRSVWTAFRGPLRNEDCHWDYAKARCGFPEHCEYRSAPCFNCFLFQFQQQWPTFLVTVNPGIHLVMSIWEWAADWKKHQATCFNSISEACCVVDISFLFFVDDNCTWRVLVASRRCFGPSNICGCHLPLVWEWYLISPFWLADEITQQSRDRLN
jgi:hypothetical protein